MAGRVYKHNISFFIEPPPPTSSVPLPTGAEFCLGASSVYAEFSQKKLKIRIRAKVQISARTKIPLLRRGGPAGRGGCTSTNVRFFYSTPSANSVGPPPLWGGIYRKNQKSEFAQRCGFLHLTARKKFPKKPRFFATTFFQKIKNFLLRKINDL